MKHFLLLAFLPFLGFGQDTLWDDFSDANLSQNLEWMGDDSLFQVNSNMELQLNANSSGHSYLVTKSKISQKAEWNFKVKLGFNPSSSNYLKIYLCADQKDIKGAVNGYFVRVGGSSQDKLSLYRQSGNNIQLLTESPASYLNNSSVELNISILRDSNSLWSLLADTGAVVNPLVLLGSALDSTFSSTSYFGLNCKYTTTRSKLFFFDDLNAVGFPYQDLIKPELDTLLQEDKNSIKLVFNEPITKKSSENILNFWVNKGLGNPISAELDSLESRVLRLNFVQDFIYGEVYSLKIDGVKDTSGNINSDSLDFQIIGSLPELRYFQIKSPNILQISYDNLINEQNAIDVSNYLFNSTLELDSVSVIEKEPFYTLNLYFKDSIYLNKNIKIDIVNQYDTNNYRFQYSFHFSRINWMLDDVLINEILPDPSPVVGVFPQQIPEFEYLEIYNRTDNYLNLMDWELLIREDTVKLNFYNLKPKGYLVLVGDENQKYFVDSIDVLGIDISSSALLNSGADLALLGPKGSMINEVSYVRDWYNNSGKDDGGWSLERIDPNSSCNGIVNWKPNENRFGGSPGFQNSVQGEIWDSISPKLNSIILFGDSLLSLQYDKELDESLTYNSSWLTISPPAPIEYFVLEEPRIINIKFLNKLDLEISYVLKWINSPEDCFGNRVHEDSIPFAIPVNPLPGEILLNEILFNPYPGASDFVELYNNSEKVFDLSKMRIGNWNAKLSVIEHVSNISNDSKLFFPKTYLVLSEDANSVADYYESPKGALFLELTDVPSMADDEGSLCVVNSNYEVLDFLEYKEEQHSAFLSDREGVSLERVSQTSGSSLWYSASSQSGFATPGYENSQNKEKLTRNGISLNPKLFSPNLDGYNDFVEVKVNSDFLGFIVDVSVWNSDGKRVRVLKENCLLGTDSFLIWEGDDDNQNALSSGIYIVLLEGINPNGQTIAFKETCVLSR